MNVSGKNIRVLLSKPLKWFCVLLILLISALSFADNHEAGIAPMVKVIQSKIELPPHTQHVSRLIKKHIAALSLQANTPPDITMNVCGTSATLTPVFPATGYNNSTLIWNDASTQPTLNVTGSGTYWWQVTGPSVVNNGAFSTTSPTGFTSDYTNVTTTTPNGSQLYPEADYAIGKNPQAYHSSFTSFGDHTTGTGNMLIVNGSSVANKTVWAQNISITANTDYVFSFWATSATSQNPAILQFSLNNNINLSTVTLSSTLANGVWQYFTATWNSGGLSGSIPIALVNQNTSTSGNDFAVDDIVFAPVYRQNIIVNLNPIPVLSVIGEICGVPSYDLTQTIVGYAPGTYNYTFKDGSGNILSGTQITSAPVGTYTITETNIATGCTSNSQNTTVSINPVPTLSVTSTVMVCGVSYDLKNAISGYDATTYTYTYKDSGGNTLASSVVTTGGAYTITATNNATGCVSNPKTVNVTFNPIPTFTATSPTLACGTTSYNLSTAISGAGGTYTYTYQDSGGNTLGSSTVTTSGTYSITATSAAGCTTTHTVAVSFNPIPVVAVVGTVCIASGTYDLRTAVIGYDPSTYNYVFKKGGTTLGTGASNNYTKVGTGVNYTVTATSAAGCTSVQQTIVVQNGTPPTFTVTSQTLCGVTSFNLFTAISAAGGTYTYTYMDSGGNTLGSSTVTTSGTYYIMATTAGGCQSVSQSITITFKPAPTFTATSPTLACGVTSYDLSQAISGAGGTYTYTYQDSGGNTLTSSTVNASGTYTITATNSTTGCVSTQTVTVTLKPTPVLAVTSPAAQCGGTYDLTQAINGWDPTTYTYKDGSGNVLTRPTNITASGTYTITETNKTTGCISAPQTVTVTINPIPVLSVTSPPAQCGGSFDLYSAINSPDPTVTYTYSSGTSSVTTSGAYIVTATKNGCSTTATVNVIINSIPVLTLTGPNAACGTYDLTLTIVGGYDSATYNYVFKDPLGNVITLANAQAITQSGTYTITEQNKSTGCTSLPQPTTVTISPNPPKPGINTTY
jgi:mucin-2